MKLPHHIERNPTTSEFDPPPADDALYEYRCRRCGAEFRPATAAQAKRFVKKHGARACDPAAVERERAAQKGGG